MLHLVLLYRVRVRESARVRASISYSPDCKVHVFFIRNDFINSLVLDSQKFKKLLEL